MEKKEPEQMRFGAKKAKRLSWRLCLIFAGFWFIFSLMHFSHYLESKRTENLIFSLSWLVLGIGMSAISFALKTKDKELTQPEESSPIKIKLPKIIYMYFVFALCWFGIGVVHIFKLVKFGESYRLVFGPTFFLIGLAYLYVFWVMKTGRGSRRPYKREIVVEGERQKIIDTCIIALGKMKARIIFKDLSKGIIVAEKGMSFSTFGELISLNIQLQDETNVLVKIESKLKISIPSFQIDMGINIKNVNKFCREFQKQ